MEEKKIISEEELNRISGGENEPISETAAKGIATAMVESYHQFFEENPEQREELIEGLKTIYIMGINLYQLYMSLYPNG